MATAPTISPATPVPAAPASGPAAGSRAPEHEDAELPLPADSDWPMHSEFDDLAQDDTDRPLPIWMRVAIVVVALVAFFVVSLLATKKV
jgi:hypothetical protein